MVVGEGDLAIRVYLPPEGKVWNYETGRLDDTDVIVRSTIKTEQFWEPPTPSKDYSRRMSREKEMKRLDANYVDTDLQKYRAREWHRRKFGAWFLNNGKMTYLTGLYYYYLTHWRIDIGLPKFRLPDLKKAYITDYVVNDPDAYGLIEITKRRIGKTFWAGCFITEHATRVPNSWSGIQSKVEADAKSVFGKACVQPFRKLPDFFKPQYDRSQGDVPKRELRFYKSSKRGELDSNQYDVDSELESLINYRNSKPEAYDGEKLTRYMCDEVFKTIDLDVLKRHYQVKPCFEDSDGWTILGKAIYTSTVEDMEGYLESYEQLWKDSDQSKRQSDSRTKSGLYRFFTPAQDMIYLDKYGIPDSKRGLEHLMKRRLDLIDDPRALASFIRKNPTTWQEAFRTDGDNCLYNAIKIDDRLDLLNWKKDYETRYDLLWEDEEKTKVKLVKTSKGRFQFSWIFEDPDKANNVHIRGTNVIPKNILHFVIGIDPYDHNRTKTGRFSKGAAAVYRKFDPFDQGDSDNFVAIYANRPQTAAIFYEDMIKLCHYFGCQMLFEDQKQGIRAYFHDRGYAAFIMVDEKGNEGISASTKSHQSIVEHTELFIDEHCHRVNHPELLRDWKDFKLDDTEKFDLGMASGYALIAAKRIKRRHQTLQSRGRINPNKFQRRYKLKKNGKLHLSKSLRQPKRKG